MEVVFKRLVTVSDWNFQKAVQVDAQTNKNVVVQLYGL